MPGSRRGGRREDEIRSGVFRPIQARSGRNDSTRATRENIIGTLVRFGGAAMSPMFRYFLGFQLATDRAGWLARRLPSVSGDLFAGLKPQNYHLTLCTIDETSAPHPFLRQRVAKAFEAGLPAAAAIPFGRIVSRDAGAEQIGRAHV